MKISTERSLNRCLTPVSTRIKDFPHKIDFDLSLLKFTDFQNLEDIPSREENCQILNSPWTYKNFIIMDLISGIILETVYKRKAMTIPSKPHDVPGTAFINFNNAQNEIYDLDEVKIVSSVSNIFSKYTFLKKVMTYREFLLLLQSTSQCSIKIPFYDFRTLLTNGDKLKRFPYYKIKLNKQENLFDVRFLTQNESEKIEDKIFELSFNSLFGRLFCSNVLTINLDYHPEEFYFLPQNTQNLYRLIISHEFSKVIILSFHKIGKKMNIYDNCYNHYNIIRDSLKRLVKLNLISEFNEIKHGSLSVEIKKC